MCSLCNIYMSLLKVIFFAHSFLLESLNWNVLQCHLYYNYFQYLYVYGGRDLTYDFFFQLHFLFIFFFLLFLFFSFSFSFHFIFFIPFHFISFHFTSIFSISFPFDFWNEIKRSENEIKTKSNNNYVAESWHSA